MNISADEIARLLAEVKEPLQGAFLNKIYQSTDDEFVFEFRKEGEKLWLLVSVSPRHSRLHLVSAAPGRRAEAGPFAQVLKKKLLRRPLASISQLPNDRVVFLGFAGREGAMTVVAELMGSSGDVYLLAPDRTILAAALLRKSKNRVGRQYAEPAPSGGGRGGADIPVMRGDDGEFAFNRAMEERYGELAGKDRLDSAKRRALAPVKDELKKIKKRKRKMEAQKEELGANKEHKRLGDLLQANYGQLKKGMRSVEVEDLFTESGGAVTIKLDPALSPDENARAYYKRHRKYEKGMPRLEAELEELEAREKKLAEKVKILESARTLDELPEEAAAPAPPKKAGKKAAKKGKVEPGPRRFHTSDGFEVLVGRSDRENDEITFRIANGRDLWLHARDYPGSHVLVRLPKGVEAPRSTLLDAAMLALNYSKAAKAGKGEVTYCHAKNLRKPKGFAPGKVLVTGEKSVFVRIDPAKVRDMKTS